MSIMKPLLAIAFIFSCAADAQQEYNAKCLSLEGKFIGCVPSENHGCFRLVAKNVEERATSGSPFTCYYITNYKKELRNPDFGPLPMNCQAWKPEASACLGTEGGCPASMCDVFASPTCREICDNCVDEDKTYDLDFRDIGCSLLSDGSNVPMCSGPGCRSRCFDEPFAGGVHHPKCLSQGDGCGEPTTACMDKTPQCADTFPGRPAYNSFPAVPADPNFKSVNEKPKICANINKCPSHVDYRGDRVSPLPDGTYPECIDDQGRPVPKPPGSTGCPGSSHPVSPVTISKPALDSCPDKQRVPQRGSPGASCPWVAPFGSLRQECGPIPCCCQFDAAAGKSKAEIPGACAEDCKGSCSNYLDSINCSSKPDEIGNCRTSGASTSSAKK